MMDWEKKVKKGVRDYVEHYGSKYSIIAKRAGISRQMLYYWLNDLKGMKPETIRKIQDVIEQ
jgi:DNA invertase Pin-like site-specific DNA recombinase